MSGISPLRITVGDLVFDGRAAGPDDGALVLLLHGFPQTSWAWRNQLVALADAGYRAVAPDQRGYSPGARPLDVAAYHPERLVEDVIGIADALGHERFHLVGHDFGGSAAWHTASRHPERLHTLTVLSTPHPRAMARSILGGGEQREKSSYMLFFRSPEAESVLLADGAAGLRELYAGSGLTDHDEYVRALTEPGALTGALNWYRALDRGAIERMGPVTTPTLFVWSTEDPAIGRAAAVATADLVNGPYRFEMLERISHWIPEEAADAVNRLLLDFLGSWSATPS